MSTKFNIPELGTSFKLAEDWQFALHHEHRNRSLFEVLGLRYLHDWHRNPNPRPTMVTLPKGTILKVDRIYIRKGASDYSSVTFLAPGKKTTKKTETKTSYWYTEPMPGDHIAPGVPFTYLKDIPARGVRFWVKLFDANTIVFEEVV